MILLLSMQLLIAAKLDITVGENYNPGDEVEFIINLYDDSNNKLNDSVNYEIVDFYTEKISESTTMSGAQTKFKLPDNAIRGYWAIIAVYNGQEQKQLFNVMELEKALITLDGETIIVKNVGNVPYRKPIQILIGEFEETALVPLGIGETKEIKLTAPVGVYTVKVSDGTEDNNLVFENVGLTGNVVGLEKEGGKNLLTLYPIITLFIVVVFAIVVFIGFLRMRTQKLK